MELKEKIEKLQKDYILHLGRVNEILYSMGKLTKLYQPSFDELMKDFNKYVFCTVPKEQDYWQQVNGDGRMEKRTGLVSVLEIIDGYYLSSEQIEFVKQYFKNTLKVKHFEVKTKY